jgi:hypothetical protein
MDPISLEEEHPDIYVDGPTPEMEAVMDAEIEKIGGRLPWTGEWPGKDVCREFGWYAKLVPGKGWVSTTASDPDGSEDLNRIYRDADWDVSQRKWVKRISKLN